MIREILSEAASLVSLMLFGATLLIWCGLLAQWSQGW